MPATGKQSVGRGRQHARRPRQRVEIEWLVCGDPEDPGTTERWSERHSYDAQPY